MYQFLYARKTCLRVPESQISGAKVFSVVNFDTNRGGTEKTKLGSLQLTA